MTSTWTDHRSSQKTHVLRAAPRRSLAMPGRLTWKDQRGATRFATVFTRDVSEIGVFVECQSPVAIPLFRLVQFQLDGDLSHPEVPATLQQGRVLSAVYRVRPATKSGGRQGYALRLMVDPKRLVGAGTNTRATA